MQRSGILRITLSGLSSNKSGKDALDIQSRRILLGQHELQMKARYLLYLFVFRHSTLCYGC